MKKLLLIFVSTFCLNNIFSQCTIPSFVTATPPNICIGGTSNLNATSVGFSINWYTVSVGGIPIGSSASGANYPVSPTVTTTYYAEAFSVASATFNYSGGVQTYVVPGGVTTLTVDVMGAQGGFCNDGVTGTGGKGGRVTGTIAVVPGQVLNIYVGGRGANGVSAFGGGGAGGYNGGGRAMCAWSFYAGGGGGGGSDIRVTPYAFANRLVVAGGGGGGAINYVGAAGFDRGGMGGGLNGEGGYSGNMLLGLPGPCPGAGGTQFAGGVWGAWPGYCAANSGVLGIGGDGGLACDNSGGGGGGGYYGGGGSSWGGGGGGSNYLPGGVHYQGYQSGDGKVIITGTGCVSVSRTAVTVTVSPTPTITASSGTICTGSSFTISPSGASSYTYAGGSAVVSPTATTTYTVIGASAAGCLSGIITVTVTVNPTPTITVNSGTICSGSSFTMLPGGAISYTYAGGSAIVSPTTTTTYTVRGSSAAGCLSNIVTSTVTVNTTPTITVNSGTICSGSSFTMIPGGATSYTYAGGSSVVSPTITTTYTLIGSSAAGCVSAPVTSTVTVNPTPTITVNSGTICLGQSFTMIPGGAASYTYAGGSAVVSPTTTTTYTVRGTSAAGCLSNIVTATVTINPTPTITVNSGTICSGQSFTMVPGGAVSYTYAGGSSVVSPTTTTTYTVIGSLSSGCLSNIVTSTVTVNTTPTITVNSGTICSGSSFTMIPGGAVSYTYAGGSSVVSPTITTTYTVIGSSLLGCVSAPVTSTLTVNTTPTITVNSGTICSGQSFTMVPGGAASYTYAGGSSIITPTTTTTYTVQGSSLAGCLSNIVTSTVTVNTTPTITVNSGTICSSQSFTMLPLGAVSYAYAGGSSVVSPTITTTYTVTGSSLGCVSAPVTSTVTVNTTPTITVNSGSICSGQSFTMNPLGAISYTYAGGSSVVSPMTTTTYTIIGSSLAGCVSVPVTSTVIVNITPTITVNSGTICSGQSFTMNPTGASSYTYASGSAIVSPMALTTYTVLGSSVAGCLSNLVTSTVAVNITPTITVNSGTICFGSSFTMTPGGAPSYTYAGGSAIVSPTTTSTYTVIGSSLGCVSSVVTSTVAVSPPPIVTVNNGTICSGQSFTMTPGGGSVSYTITGGSAIVSPTTTTTYTITGSNAIGCVSVPVTLTVTVYTTPTISVNSGTICAGQSFTMSPTGAASYVFSSGGTAVVAPLATTIFTVTGTSLLGCVSAPVTSTLIVNQNPVVAIAGKTVICSGKSATLTLSGAATYSWSPSTYLDTAVGATVTSTPKTSTVYTITAVSAEGCISITAAPVNVIQTPSISVSASQTLICEGQSTSLATSGAFTFSWSPPNSLSSVSSNPTTANPTVTTTYTVEGFNLLAANSCVASNTVQVVVIPKVIPNIDPVLPLCLGQSTTLKASGGTTYTWSPVDGLSKPTSSLTVAQPTVTTLYTVKISKGGLCTREATVNIVVNPLPIVDAGKDTTVNIGESITLIGQGNVTVGFSNSDGSPLYCNYCSSVTVSPKESTCYELKGENSFGCSSTDDVCVRVTKDWDVFIPNSFTPDEDGINENFIPQGYGMAKMSLTIYDRWGTKLFYEDSVEKGWDGKFQSKLCKQDVYVFTVEIKTMEGIYVKKTGHLTLISKVK